MTDNVGVDFFNTTLQNGSRLTWGEYNVTYIARDKAGNTAYCNVLILIEGEQSYLLRS